MCVCILRIFMNRIPGILLLNFIWRRIVFQSLVRVQCIPRFVIERNEKKNTQQISGFTFPASPSENITVSELSTYKLNRYKNTSIFLFLRRKKWMSIDLKLYMYILCKTNEVLS